MTIKSCIPVIPSANLEKSLRFWVEGLGLTVDQEMKRDEKLVGCMVHNEHLYFWLNQRAGTPVRPEDYHSISLYWAPADINETWAHLKQLGYEVSDIEDRDYGQTESSLLTTTAILIVLGLLPRLNSDANRHWKSPFCRKFSVSAGFLQIWVNPQNPTRIELNLSF